jgi:hypothetical protein
MKGDHDTDTPMTDDQRRSIHPFLLAPCGSLLKRNLNELGQGSG